MLEVTSYGLITLGVILVAAFCSVWVEEKATLQTNRSPSLVDERKMNQLRIAGTAAANRSRKEPAGREDTTGLELSLQVTSPSHVRASGPDGNSQLGERGPEGASHG